MERPAKRPRLLKTVEVDEADPDYARAEQETTQRFKANWEAILEKYGNENLDQGDEIDLVTGEVVVDRGHLRGMEDGCDDTNQFLMDFVTEELDEDSADELAPEHPPKKLIAKGTEEEHTARSILVPLPTNPAGNPEARVGDETTFIQPTPKPTDVPPIPQSVTPQQPSAAAFQAFCQAVWPIFTNFMGQYNGATPSTMPSTATSTVDARWNEAPPLEVGAPHPPPITPSDSSNTNSSPLVARANRRPDSPRRSVWAIPGTRTRKLARGASATMAGVSTKETEEAQISAPNPTEPAEPALPLAETSANVNIGTGRKQKYYFSAEDDQYIIIQREAKKLRWKEIRLGRQGWEDWPEYAVIQRYRKLRARMDTLRGQETELHTRSDLEGMGEDDGDQDENDDPILGVRDSEEPTPSQDGTGVRVEVRIQKPPSLPLGPEQLPTPSPTNRSSKDLHSTFPDDTVEPDETVGSNIGDEEANIEGLKELDTIKVVANSEEPTSIASESHSARSSIAPDDILESVETDVTVILPPLSPEIPDTETPVLPVDTKSIAEPIAARNSTIMAALESELKTPKRIRPPRLAKSTGKAKQPPENDVDPIQIKEESMTPPAHALMISHLPFHATPKSAPQPSSHAQICSSGSKSIENPSPVPGKSASKLEKSSFLKRIKQQWSQKKKAVTPVAVKQKKLSAMNLGRKRKGWDDGSEDELAM